MATMTPTKVSKDVKTTSLLQAGKLVREAFDAGRKIVVIDGISYLMTPEKRKVRFTIGGQPGHPVVHHKRTENWIICTRVDGRPTPVLSIERKFFGNVRSISNKNVTGT